MRKKTVLIVVLGILVLVIALYVSRESRVIGEITGAEWNILTIGETEYRQIMAWTLQLLIRVSI